MESRSICSASSTPSGRSGCSACASPGWRNGASRTPPPRPLASSRFLSRVSSPMAGDRLSGLDASFLHLEDDSAHMHVASVIVFEGKAPHYVELLEHIDRRLHLVPRFRQRLAFVPFGQGRPRWVDDP